MGSSRQLLRYTLIWKRSNYIYIKIDSNRDPLHDDWTLHVLDLQILRPGRRQLNILIIDTEDMQVSF